MALARAGDAEPMRVLLRSGDVVLVVVRVRVRIRVRVRAEPMRVLLRSDDVHAQYRSMEGSTPLHEACSLPKP